MGHILLVLVDAYTKWPEVHIMKNMSAHETIDKCREIFASFGLPQTVVTDNGRTFTAEFQNFLKNNGINHKGTAPYHPAMNGLAERFVQTLKQALRKLDITNGNIKTNLQKFLFNYRLTPHPELNKSSAEAMFSRKIRSRLDLMFPKINNEQRIENDKILKIFKRGERVAIREYLNKSTKWRFGNINARLGKLYYEIKLDDGRIWKRHINQMKKIGNQIANYTSNLSDMDHNGPIDTTKECVTAENNDQTEHLPQNFDSDSSKCSRENSLIAESEEGEAGEAEVPQTPILSIKTISERNQNASVEGRPQRNRKPPERYGNYLSLFKKRKKYLIFEFIVFYYLLRLA
ncbi:Uncharacterized protein K02A2.6 [Cyphomyrmex costatus]|uniref:Uncharacterized protein K02A2.6 n=1 Tax=Cyphomyrmex costatus TaxID=456900 RepID=A0A151INP7_9HYME|nr:Uncharacterized protein K02A2.6 [Cyphomyrmex costatus]